MSWWFVVWCFGASVVSGVVLRGWVGDALFVTRYTGYVMAWLLVGLVPAAIVAARSHRVWLAMLLVAGTVLVALETSSLLRYRPAIAAPASTLPVTVVSYNTWSRNDADARIAAVVLEMDPDILLLQEIPSDVLARVLDRLRARESPLHASYDAELMQAVLSRWDIVPQPSLPREGQAQKVIVRAPAGPIAVYNVHPLRGGGWEQRYGEIAALLQERVFRETGPVLVGGDFNTTPQSEMYLLLSRYLRNAQDEAGSGFAFTFPSSARRFGFLPLVPAVRIDHIFFSGHFVALRAGTGRDSGGSDHLPVFAALAQRQPGRAGREVPQAKDAREVPSSVSQRDRARTLREVGGELDRKKSPHG